jgi:hypothetical protein
MPVLTHCPECDKSLDSIDPDAHALRHWAPYIEPRAEYAEARRRQALLIDEGARRRANPGSDPSIGVRGTRPPDFEEVPGSPGAGS